MCILRFAYLCASVQTQNICDSQQVKNSRINAKLCLLFPLLIKRLPNGYSKRICAEVIL